jgi:deoxycytidylate deaminase
LKNSRPCNHCIDKLIKVGIYKVYYSNENGIIVSEIVEDMEKLHISSGTKYQLSLK